MATSVVLYASRRHASMGEGRFSPESTRAYELHLKARMEDLVSSGWSSLFVATSTEDRLGRRVERAKDWIHVLADGSCSRGSSWEMLLERCALDVDSLIVLFGDREAIAMERLWKARHRLATSPQIVIFGEAGEIAGFAGSVASLRVISRLLSGEGLGSETWEELAKREHLKLVTL